MNKKGQKRKKVKDKVSDSNKHAIPDAKEGHDDNEDIMDSNSSAPKKARTDQPDLADQSLDDFLQSWQEDDGEQHGSDTEDSEREEDGDLNDDADDANEKYLSKLAQKDPEFYQFLQENDKEALAGIEDSDDSSDSEEEDAVHQVPDSLEMASDESDFEEEEEEEEQEIKRGKGRGKGPVVIKRRDLNMLEERLITAPTVKAVADLAQMFRAALNSLGGQEKQKEAECSDYVVEGSTMFNSVVRTCLTKMAPSLFAVLGVKESDAAKNLSLLAKSKKWSSLNRSLRCYTLDLTRLLSALAEDDVRGALLKHCHVMLPFFAAMAKSCKHLTAQLVKLWSTGEESVRVLAFLCLVRLTRLLNRSNYDTVVKQMYMSYVRNCRFTSPSTWPLIAFMRRSLAEMLALDPAAAYNHTFIYTRQLGISLRNALMAQKKESIQAVYNWQFVHSCHLWAQFLGSMSSSEVLSPLVFPLTQVIQGAIKLVYVTRYYPLRFHLAQVLDRLCLETGTFVPVLPHYLDILQSFDFNRKTSRVSMRPVDFSCLLKVNKIQLQENGMKDTTMDKVGKN